MMVRTDFSPEKPLCFSQAGAAVVEDFETLRLLLFNLRLSSDYCISVFLYTVFLMTVHKDFPPEKPLCVSRAAVEDFETLRLALFNFCLSSYRRRREQARRRHTHAETHTNTFKGTRYRHKHTYKHFLRHPQTQTDTNTKTHTY